MRYRVAVFCATEEERRTAVRILGGHRLDPDNIAYIRAAAQASGRELRPYRGVAKVWCTPGELEALRDAGLTVDILRDRAHPGLPLTHDPRMTGRNTVPANVIEQLRESSDRVSVDGDIEVTDQPGSFRESRDDMYRLELRSPLDEERRAKLSELDIAVSEFEPPNGYWMYLTPSQHNALVAQDWVVSAVARPFGASLTPELLASDDAGASTPDAATAAATDAAIADTATATAGPAATDTATATAGPAATDTATATAGDADAAITGAAGAAGDTYDVLLHRASDLDVIRAMFGGTEILFAIDVMIRFRTRLTGQEKCAFVAAVARLHEVRSVTPYRPPMLYVDHARKLVGLAPVVAATLMSSPQWTGEGQIVAFFDSGMDASHPDLADRIAVNEALVGQAVDLIGHGTHVAGIIAGSGAASQGAIVGCAPGAKLAAFRITDDDGQVQVPPCLGLILGHAAAAGAKIINLSWGHAFSGPYDMYALGLDKFVYEHPDILVIIAAGNDGKAPKGDHLFNTVGTPATAKNALTVGACGTDRADFAEVTWSKFRHAQFPLPPAGTEPLADPDVPAALSSRGPTDYGGIKPELLAPGTFILATRMAGHRIDPRLIWKDCPDHDGKYVYIGGTSMAAPVVAGAAAVLRQYLAVQRGLPNPSAALVKALLIASSQRLSGLRTPGSWADVGYPDFDQGFGRLDLKAILEHDCEFADVANDSPRALESYASLGGERRSSAGYRVPVTAGTTLRVVLAWTDRPGGAVQNNLNLSVIDPAGRRLAGNHTHHYQKNTGFELGESDALDKLNNVEQVIIDDPQPGSHRIRVTAQNTVFPPQGYALVVSGKLGALTAEA